jgi:hypothetical protein
VPSGDQQATVAQQRVAAAEQVMACRRGLHRTAARFQEAGDGYVGVAVGEAEQQDLAGVQDRAVDADDLGVDRGRGAAPDNRVAERLQGQARLLGPFQGAAVVP